jgi:hypothetical protein
VTANAATAGIGVRRKCCAGSIPARRLQLLFQAQRAQSSSSGLCALTGADTAGTVVFVSATVDSFLDEYTRRYEEGDVRGVTNLCNVPFFAVRRGEAINMPDSGAVWDHFAGAIGAYRRAAGVETWTRLETDIRQLGEHSVFASVHWNALDANEEVVRDTWTSYQLLAGSDGWRLLSYTNHF